MWMVGLIPIDTHAVVCFELFECKSHLLWGHFYQGQERRVYDELSPQFFWNDIEESLRKVFAVWVFIVKRFNHFGNRVMFFPYYLVAWLLQCSLSLSHNLRGFFQVNGWDFDFIKPLRKQEWALIQIFEFFCFICPILDLLLTVTIQVKCLLFLQFLY